MANVLGDLGQDCGGSLPIVLSSQPPGRLVAKYEADEKSHCWQRLHSQGDLPCSVCFVDWFEILVGSLEDNASQEQLL